MKKNTNISVHEGLLSLSIMQFCHPSRPHLNRVSKTIHGREREGQIITITHLSKGTMGLQVVKLEPRVTPKRGVIHCKLNITRVRTACSAFQLPYLLLNPSQPASLQSCPRLFPHKWLPDELAHYTPATSWLPLKKRPEQLYQALPRNHQSAATALHQLSQ